MNPCFEEPPIDADTILSSIEELMSDMNGPSQDFKDELAEFMRGFAKKVAKTHKVKRKDNAKLSHEPELQ